MEMYRIGAPALVPLFRHNVPLNRHRPAITTPHVRD
jgi:hypothetical protein